MSATRVIIDMQPVFAAANHPDVIVGVVKEVMDAMRQRAPILIVEFRGEGVSHRGLLNLVKGYDRAVKVYKYNNGGAAEIVRALQRHKFAHRHFRVCGVNTNACVQATVTGMLNMPLLAKSKIELVKSACGTSSETFRWRDFPKHPNLKLV